MAVIFCDAAIDKSTLNSIVSERLSASKQRAKKPAFPKRANNVKQMVNLIN